MKRMLAAVVIAALMTTASIGCGGPSDAEKQAEAKKERVAKKRAKDRRQAAACVSTFGDLQDAVDELDSRLNVGLNYQSYTTEVADIRVVYDQTDFDGLDDPACLTTVGLPLERAMNQYVKAAGIWDDCFSDIDCDNDSIQPDLQERWTKASGNATVASTAIDTMTEK